MILFQNLKNYAFDFIAFGLKQAYACIFGTLLLVGILISALIWQNDWAIARYDFLFFYAIAIQAFLLLFRLETWREAGVILLFHIVGTIMEIFKTHVGSWVYPEDNFIRLYGVPLFSGFMYSAVGSYIARVWRLFDFKLSHYPNLWATAILCALIYINFFTHHYIWDSRWVLFAACGFLYFRTNVYFTPYKQQYRMPLLIGFILMAFFIWIAENIGTLGSIWLYPTQEDTWHIVSFAKMGSWFLLMIISFVLVTFLQRPQPKSRWLTFTL